MFARQTMPATRRSGHRPLALRCLGAAVGLALLAAPAALAQDADTSDNTPVSHDGAGLGSTESGSSLSQSFAGTGRVLAAGETDDALADRRGLKESAADVWKLWEAAPATAPVGVESILGADNRERVRNTSEYPYRAIALVTFTDANGSSSRCTGWLINADTVVTAGHCVHGGGSGEDWHRVNSFRVYPGRDGSASPYGSCTAKRLYSVRGWTRNAADTSDYGAIKLNCNIGNRVGWFGFFWSRNSLDNLPLRISGYPGDKNLTQWRDSDRVRVSQKKRVFYGADTLGGQSGSPVYYNRSSNCNPCSMAVHAYGIYGSFPFSTYNHGTRITQGVYQNLNDWKNAN